MRSQVIHIHSQAPTKPAFGDACNGCGVCCLAEPCPLGILVSRRRSGACTALVWDEGESRYRCGAVVSLAAAVQGKLPWLPERVRGLMTSLLRKFALRWISAGSGCDSTLAPSPTMEPPCTLGSQGPHSP